VLEAVEASTMDHARAGGRVLKLLGRPLNCMIVEALGRRPMRLAELLKALGGPAPTTVRMRLVELVDLGVVAKRGGGMPYAVENELTEVGRDLLTVVEALEGWLSRAPGGAIPFGTVATRGAIKALALGWESTMLRAFAARPLSLTQLDSLIAGLSYPALERRLSALRATGLVEPMPAGTRTPYTVSHWGREAVGPLAAAVRFERLHMASETIPPAPIDVEAKFLLAMPIAKLSARTDGACQLAAQLDGDAKRLAGVNVAIDRGRVVECVARLEPQPATRALGSAPGWLDAFVRRDTARLQVQGDGELIRSLVHGVHDALFSPVGAARALASSAALASS
jgi:DNA-binding HxlR family transcriptional regulator